MDTLEEREGKECTCDESHYSGDCPFAEDVHNRSENCTCCPYCRHECAMDI